MQLSTLLVLLAPEGRPQPALERAIWLAQQCGARLDLLYVDFNPVFEHNLLLSKHSLQQAREGYLNELNQWLHSLTEPLLRQGLKVKAHLRWGSPQHQEVLKHLAEHPADLILKSHHHPNLLERLHFGHEDWQLLRHCAEPLWLARETTPAISHLAAALDPTHSADKPAALDHALILAARTLSERLNLRADYLHCHQPLPPSLLFDAELMGSYPQYRQESLEQHQKALYELTGPYQLPDSAVHFLPGLPEEALPAFIEQQGIDLLLMGAISRSKLKELLLGHTAERLMQHLPCDLLILKPRAHAKAPS